MRIGGKQYRVDWGHLLLIAFMACVVIAYLMSARARSLNVNNLLLVQPAAVLALFLCVVVALQCFVREPGPGEAPLARMDADRFRDELWNLFRIAAMAGAFGLFAFNLETVGFDVAAWLFVCIGLYICGERKLLVLALYPAAFTAALVYFFRALVPFPLPTLVI